MSKPSFPSDTPELAAARAALQRVLGQQRRGQPEPAAVAQPRVLDAPPGRPTAARIVEPEPVRPAVVLQEQVPVVPRPAPMPTVRGELVSAVDAMCLHVGRVTATGAELYVWFGDGDTAAARVRTWAPFNDIAVVEINPHGALRSFSVEAEQGPPDAFDYAMQPYRRIDSEPSQDELTAYVRQHLLGLLTPEARRRLAALVGGAGCAAT
ncbi:MAG: hypothetical protein J0M00_03435 [Burkholderiales bacterium]|nr:hypothetical protein [Burkholderiales bacterium]